MHGSCVCTDCWDCRFVSNAPKNVLETEQRKKIDAEAKIKVIKDSIDAF